MKTRGIGKTKPSDPIPTSSVDSQITTNINMDVESLTTIMKGLIRDEIRPIKDNMESLSAKFNNMHAIIQHVKNTADNAESRATDALTKTSLVESRVTRLESALRHSEDEQKKLYAKTLQLESYSRRLNPKFFQGNPESKDEICMDLAHENISLMGLDPTIQIVSAHRLGPYRKNQRSPRPVILRFGNSADRLG